MKRLNSEGFIRLLLPFMIVSIIAVAAIIFGVWAFNGRQYYKDNVNALIATAVQNEKTKEANQLNQKFQLESQNPYTSYTGPSQYGSIYVAYPKNWSGYVDDTGTNNPLDEYFNPVVVPAIGGTDSLYALRVEVNANPYSTQLANYTSQQQTSNLTITPYSLPKVPSVVGVKISGQIEPNISGVMVMLPLRTNTLEIWTEQPQYINLFVGQILPQISFQP